MSLVVSTARAGAQDAGSVARTTSRSGLAAHEESRHARAEADAFGTRRGALARGASRRRGEARSWGPSAAADKGRSLLAARVAEPILGCLRGRPASVPGTAAKRGSSGGSGTGRQRGLGLAARASLAPRRLACPPSPGWLMAGPPRPQRQPGGLRSGCVGHRTGDRGPPSQGARAAEPAQAPGRRRGRPPRVLAAVLVGFGDYGQESVA